MVNESLISSWYVRTSYSTYSSSYYYILLPPFRITVVDTVFLDQAK